MTSSNETPRLIVAKALWGMNEEEAIEPKLDRIAAAGYDAVECESPDMGPSQWKTLLAKYNLAFIGQIEAADIESFRSAYENIIRFDPIRINSHSGRDKMSFDEGKRFFSEALRIEGDHGMPAAHETHRSRLLYAPWTAHAYLSEFEELRINADFSHWCVVCESLLDDLEDSVGLACSRAIHIHGRVGFEQGAQVSDPRAPEFAAHVSRHEEWWDIIRQCHTERGEEAITFTPEYGPPRYLQTLPYTGQPIADLWDICAWGMERIRIRWQ